VPLAREWLKSLHRGRVVRPLRILWFALPWLLVAILAAQLYPSRMTNLQLNGAVSQLSAQLANLEKQQDMPAIVLRRHRNAICYIYVVYTFDWPSNTVVRRLTQHTRVSGTGFLVGSDVIATNRHVLQPWFEDPDDEQQIREGAVPRVEKMVAFFPGLIDPVRLDQVRVSMDQDLAVARIEDGPLPDSFHPLPLAASDGEPGDPVIVVGYPLGTSTMLAKSPDRLYKRLASSKDTIQVANELAANELIRPSATCGHLSDVVDSKLIYDAPTAQGGSGGPVFNSKGEVIAVNAAYIEGFNGGTIGISSQALKPLIDSLHHGRR
jgi:serine protease Do